jgi:hypothetical protein
VRSRNVVPLWFSDKLGAEIEDGVRRAMAPLDAD